MVSIHILSSHGVEIHIRHTSMSLVFEITKLMVGTLNSIF